MKHALWSRLVWSILFVGTSGLMLGQDLALPAGTEENTTELPSALSAVTRDRLKASHRTWAEHDGAPLRPVLSYKNGTPHLVLSYVKEDRPGVLAFVNLGVVTALEFLLTDDAFDQVRLSIVEINPDRFTDQKQKDYIIQRSAFRSAAMVLANTQSLREGVNRLRDDDKMRAELCRQLGIN